VLRAYAKLKCRLMPYLYAAAVQAHETGVPVMRAMPLEFAGDPACDTLDRQYRLGERLLVASVFTPDGTVDYYLPAGCWTNYLSGEVVEGGRWLRERHGTLSLPLMVRPNTVLPVGAVENRSDYDYADGVTFHVCELENGRTVLARARVPALDGSVAMTVEVRRGGDRIDVQVQGTSASWSVLLRGVTVGTSAGVASVEGGAAQAEALGTRLVPAEGVGRLVVHL
jgi:alpha-D-xyloside xylohydrolase